MSLNNKDSKKAVDMAAGMADQFSEEEAEAFAEKHQGKNWIVKFRLLLELLKDPDFKLSNQYYWSLIAGAVVYFVSPVDLIFDFIPGGFIDDIFVISYVLYLLRDEVERYQVFKNDRVE